MFNFTIPKDSNNIVNGIEAYDILGPASIVGHLYNDRKRSPKLARFIGGLPRVYRAAKALSMKWSTNKNLSVEIQELDAALKACEHV